MASRLGCATDIQAFVTAKCGGPTVCALTNITTLEWNRILDGISTAIVEVPVAIGSGGTNPCCRCLADVEPWCHELHIFRNGEEVWCGPILRVTYGFTKVTIEAQDVLGWLVVRISEGAIDFGVTDSDGDGTPDVAAAEVTDIALQILNIAFEEEDPCVLEYVLQTDLTQRPTSIGPVAVRFEAFADTAYDQLDSLSAMGLDYTTLGRRIILSVDGENEGQRVARTLTDQHIMGEIEVSKDGLLAANRVYSRYLNDDTSAQCTADGSAIVPCPAVAESEQFCYGPIEIVRDDASQFNFNTALQIAQKYADSGSPIPRTVIFPGGSKLSPDTPFGINDIIPGNIMRVVLTNLCFDVAEDFKIQELTYSINAQGEEEIGVALGAFNLISGEI